MKFLWLLLIPSLVWAWGAPQPPPHVIDLKVKSLPNDKSPKVPVSKENPPEKLQPEIDTYRYDAPPPAKKSK